VERLGGICFLEVAPPDIVATRNGGSETLAVTTRPGCEWSVATPDPWITITSPASNTGPGTVALDIAAFDAPPGVFERSGSVIVTLADPMQTVTVPVDQDGDCSFTAMPIAQSFAVAGGGATFAVDASVPQCAWTVTSPAPWITILSPLAPVFGDGTVSYRIDANAEDVNVEAGLRSIALASEQVDYTVSQDGCTYTLDRTSIAADAAGDVSFDVDITAPAVCRWTATSHASWILVQDGTSGAGEGTVELFVLDNPTVQSRTGTVSIGDETVTVTQDGLACAYGLAPASVVACPDGLAFALDVAATDGCNWTLHEDAPWITLLDGANGAGNDRASGLVDLNPAETSRASTVQLRAQNIGVASAAVSQEGYLSFELFDATRPADWSYTPDAAWTVANGHLTGSAGQGVATALDSGAPCRECEVRASVAVATASSAPGAVLTVLGWYRDAANHAGLEMDEFSNRWTLFQVVGGTRSSVSANVAKIVPNAFYDTRLVFDGTRYAAEVDGQPLLALALQGAAPIGTAGLRSTASTARLSELRTSRIEPGTIVVDPDRIFGASFEAAEAPNDSQCRLP